MEKHTTTVAFSDVSEQWSGMLTIQPEHDRYNILSVLVREREREIEIDK